MSFQYSTNLHLESLQSLLSCYKSKLQLCQHGIATGFDTYSRSANINISELLLVIRHFISPGTCICRQNAKSNLWKTVIVIFVVFNSIFLGENYNCWCYGLCGLLYVLNIY